MTLEGFFDRHRSLALAFSGGVDSAYLLYAAKAHGCDVRAYFVRSEFQPAFELDDAKRLAEQLGATLRILDIHVLDDDRIRSNPKDRCYYCKKRIFEAVRDAAAEDGHDILIDGTNASDDVDDRPGFRALNELGVLSPLRLCGLSKADVRRLSKEAGLFTHDKPAYACLATRIPAETPITLEALRVTEDAEAALHGIGFRDLRVRMNGRDAKLQLREEQLPLLIEKRREVLRLLKPYYDNITLDLEVRS